MKNQLLIALFSLVAVFNAIAQQQPENPGFELWEEYGFGPDTLEPIEWNSLKSSDGGELINSVIPVTLERSTDAHSGMYSVKLRNDTILIFVAPGVLTNGRVHATLPPSDAYVFTIDSVSEFNTPFSDLPDSLVAWVKYYPQENDIAHIMALLHSDTAKIADSTQTNWIALASIDIAEQLDSWTRLSAPFQYLNGNTPEYILFAIYAGDAQDSKPFSVMYLDDIEFIYNETGMKSLPEYDASIIISGNELILKVSNEMTGEACQMEITDLSGKIVHTAAFSLQTANNFVLNLPAGIYFCKFSSRKLNVTRKFIIN